MKFSARDGGMTPARFVGLLVLSTMAVVAAVMILVEDPGDDAEIPPEIEFVSNETGDWVRVNATTENVSWGRIQVQMSADGGYRMGEDGNFTRTEQQVFTRIDNKSRVKEGDRIRFCLHSAAEGVNIVFRDTNTSQVIATVNFNTMESCSVGEDPEPENETGSGNETASENETLPLETGDGLPENGTLQGAALAARRPIGGPMAGRGFQKGTPA